MFEDPLHKYESIPLELDDTNFVKKQLNTESVDDDDGSNGTGGANGFGGEVTGRGSVMSRIVVEQKSREDALAEQKLDKKETQACH